MPMCCMFLFTCDPKLRDGVLGLIVEREMLCIFSQAEMAEFGIRWECFFLIVFGFCLSQDLQRKVLGAMFHVYSAGQRG